MFNETEKKRIMLELDMKGEKKKRTNEQKMNEMSSATAAAAAAAVSATPHITDSKEPIKRATTTTLEVRIRL